MVKWTNCQMGKGDGEVGGWVGAAPRGAWGYPGWGWGFYFAPASLRTVKSKLRVMLAWMA